MGKIEKILKKGPVEGQTTEVYPVTSTKAVYDENNKRLDNIITGLQESIYLNTPIPISTENTPESMAQNVKNIAGYVEKAKAAGITDVNGMAVTCIINNDYSGVGYLYRVVGGSFWVSGIITYDDALNPTVFTVNDGTYLENELVIKSGDDQVTSNMLVEGARKPIILTPSTTEVDEETYQKLLSNDVDVMFNIDGIPLYLNFKESSGDGISLWFGYITTRPISAEFPYGYSVIVQIIVTISSATPHKLVLSEPSEVAYKPDEFIEKSNLLPVLQEIDLRGTDADRKAKLDQFETDWKALTGASDLTGARFVGRFAITEDIERNVTGIMTYCAGDDVNETNDNCFYGICNGYSFSKQKSQIAVKVSCTDGSLTITPLFSHLEAITIYTDNTPEHMQANLDNIAAYEANLQALGVDVTKGWNAPISFSSGDFGIFFHIMEGEYYEGIMANKNTVTSPYSYGVRKSDGYFYRTNIITQASTISSLTTTSKQIVGAINEINANAVHSDKFVPTLEAITIKTKNSSVAKAANVAAINAYVNNLTALGVDVTKGYMIPVKLDNGYHGFIMGTDANGEHTGIIKKNTYNYGGGWIFIDNIGTYQYLECLTLGSYDNLTTTAKEIIPAINEVNALVEKKADKTLNAKSLEAITIRTGNTPENKAGNIAAIKAYVDNLKALGVDVTKGYMIPAKLDSGNLDGFVSYHSDTVDYPWSGVFIKPGGSGRFGSINKDGLVVLIDDILISGNIYKTLTTTSKGIIPAINEVNALAKGYSTIFTPIELTTDPAQNKTAIDARVAAFTAQGISLTNGCCIPVTYKGVYAGNISLINGDWYGLLVKNTNNPADNINIKLSADGTIAEGNSVQ